MTIVYYFEKQGFIVHAIIRDGRQEVQLLSSMISTLPCPPFKSVNPLQLLPLLS